MTWLARFGLRRLGCGAVLAMLIAAQIAGPANAAGAESRDQSALLFSALNESDSGKRDTLVAKAFTDQAVMADQVLRAVGQKNIAARIDTLQRSLQGQRFQPIGTAQRQHDGWRISFEVVDKTGSTAFEGTIFAVSTADGRFERVDIFTGPSAGPAP